MTQQTITKSVTVFFALIGLSSLGWYIAFDPVKDFQVLQPGMDNKPAGLQIAGEDIAIGAYFKEFDGQPSTSITSSWPRFRGADFDNISKESVRLVDQISEDIQPVWEIELGEGHSGPVVVDGRVFVMDYDEENRRDQLRCFSLDDGREIWRRGYDIYIKRNHGMSRTVPAVQDSYVVTMGPKCQVMCVSADSGAYKWGIDIAKEYQSEVPLWYTGQCPLIDDSIAVIATGGSALLVGVDLDSGSVVWETPNPNGWNMSHSSVIPMTILGKDLYVYEALGGLVGISADSATLGQVMFETSTWSPTVIAPSPVQVDDDKIFVTAGYGAGSMLFQLNPSGEGFSVNVLQAYKPDEGLASEQQTPILYDDHLFSILPKDAGPRRNQFVCTRAGNPADILWSSGTTRFGLGPYLVADNKFFILSDDGILTLVNLSTTAYKELGSTAVLDGHDAWGPMAIVDGRLICRDSRRMICLDVRARAL